MPKYIVTAKAFEGSLFLEYDDQNILRSFQDESDMTEDQRAWFSMRFPNTKKLLEKLLGMAKGLTCKLAEYDLTFDNFWNTYGYKIGNKKRAVKQWNGLSKPDKIRVFDSLPSYNYYLQVKSNLERLYPETYLSQRRFKTDYKAAVKRR